MAAAATLGVLADIDDRQHAISRFIDIVGNHRHPARESIIASLRHVIRAVSSLLRPTFEMG